MYNEQFGLMADPYMFLASGGNLETATTRPMAPNTGTMNFLLLHSLTMNHYHYRCLQMGMVPTHMIPSTPFLPSANPPPIPSFNLLFSLSPHPLYHYHYHDLQVGVDPTVLIPVVEEGGLWVD